MPFNHHHQELLYQKDFIIANTAETENVSFACNAVHKV